MGVRRNFSRGGNVDILFILFRLLTMQAKRTLTKRFSLSTQKEIAAFYGNSHKCTSLAGIARYIAISYKTNYPQISQAGYFFTKQQIAMVFNKTIILSLFYLARVASIT